LLPFITIGGSGVLVSIPQNLGFHQKGFGEFGIGGQDLVYAGQRQVMAFSYYVKSGLVDGTEELILQGSVDPSGYLTPGK
jgi:hypothetical protein